MGFKLNGGVACFCKVMLFFLVLCTLGAHAATATTTTITSDLSPAQAGQTVNFTATVTANPPNGTPSGMVQFFDGATLLGTGVLNLAAQTVLGASTLTVGDHNITCSYSGDSNFSPNTSSPAFVQQVRNTSSIAVTSSLSPSLFGQSITFTATVSSTGAGVPTGTVTFLDGTTVLGTSALDAGAPDVAAFTTSALFAGDHLISATYSGDGSFININSPNITQAVNQSGSQMTAVISDSNPSGFGQSVTFTATVSATAPGSGIPTGWVTFLDNEIPLSNVTLNGFGQASFINNTLSIGAHSIVAVYAGDANFIGSSTAPQLNQTVNPSASTTTTITSSLDPSLYGQTITFTATVGSTGPGTPTGSVIFSDGAVTLGTASLNAGSPDTAFLQLTSAAPLNQGSHLITAVYTGDPSFGGSTSTSLAQTVNPDSSTTAVSFSTDPPAGPGFGVFGQTITITATISGNSSTPPTPGALATGTVNFQDGSTVLAASVPVGANNQASFTLSTLSVSTHPITAVYTGDTNLFGGSSAVFNELVEAASTATTVVSSTAPNPSVFGQNVTFTATITVLAPGSGLPNGTVDFFDDVTLLGSASLDINGNATIFNPPPIDAGNHNITAVYNSTGNYNGSTSLVFVQSVDQDATAATVTSSPNPSMQGNPATFTATVIPALGGGNPSGTITFTIDGVAQLPTTMGGPGVATLTTSSLIVGDHTISVVYNGDMNFQNSATGAPVYVHHVRFQTSLAFTSSANPSVFEQLAAFTGTISSSGGTPTGTLFFIDQIAASSFRSRTSNVATITTSSAHNLFPGNNVFISGMSGAGYNSPIDSLFAPQPITVLDVPTNNTFTYSSNGLDETTTADGGGIVNIELASGALNAGSPNLVTLSTASLVTGVHSLSVIYGGDPNFISVASAIIDQTVNQDQTATALVSSINPSLVGQSVTFTATVAASAPGAGTPTGTVQFSDGASALGAPVAMNNGSATFSTSLALGSHPITATYSGDNNYVGSTNTPALDQLVDRNGSSVAVASTFNNWVFEKPITLTATVTSVSSGTPTGTITFADNFPAAVSATRSRIAGIATLTTVAPHGLSAGNIVTIGGVGGAGYNLGNVAVATTPTTTSFTYNDPGADENPALNDTGGTITLTFSTANRSRTANVATLTTASAHGLSAGNVVTISGVGGNGYNGTFVVTAPISATTFSYSDASSDEASISDLMGTVNPATTLGAALLGNNPAAASVTISTLAAGGHSIVAVYDGDNSFAPAISASLDQTINMDATAIVLVSNDNPAISGSNVTFTATVFASAPSTGVPTGPTGTVTFFDNGVALGAPVALAAGTASFSTATLTLGNHPVTAVYNGDFNYLTSSFAPALVEQIRDSSTNTLTENTGTATVFGQTITFTSTVTPALPAATGTVIFLDRLATSTQRSRLTNVATLTTTSPHNLISGQTITITGLTDNSFNGAGLVVVSILSATSFTYNINGPDLAVTADTFGTISSLLGTGVLNGSGVAALSISTLPVTPPTHVITAVFPGDITYLSSTSNMIDQIVNKDSTTTSLSSNANPAFLGQSLTFTASVSVITPGSGMPTGSVAFFNVTTGKALGTSTLSGGATPSAHVTLTAAPPQWFLGFNTITATYSGDANDVGSTNTPAPFTIDVQDSTSVVLSQNSTTTSFGQPVVFTATVSTGGAGVPAPTETVNFFDGVTLLGSQPVESTSPPFQVVLPATQTLSVGNHNISAQYAGDANYEASTSPTVVQTVKPAPTSTALSSVPGPTSFFGEVVALTANVTLVPPITGVVAAGNVTFSDGATVLGNVVLDPSGIASLSVPLLILGSQTITAQYNPSANFAASTNNLIQTVNTDTTRTTVVGNTNPSGLGQAVTFMVTITPANSNAQPAGTVTVTIDGVAQPVLTLVAGSASLPPIANLTKGAHTIDATYSGNADFIASATSSEVPAGTLTQVVDKTGTASTLTVSPMPSTLGQQVTFTATVTPVAGAGIPNGNVTFFDGSTSLGTVALNALGVATFSTTSLSVGAHPFTANYAGAANFVASNSSVVNETVRQAIVTTMIASINPSIFGESVTFTATLNAVPPGIAPTGTVIFTVDGLALASIPMTSAGASFSNGTLALGSHIITAAYSGNANFAAPLVATLTQTVNQAGSTTVVSASQNPSAIGKSVIFTTTVSAVAPGAGTPTGTVILSVDGVSQLAAATLAAGSGTFSISNLIPGTHTIVATYSGDANFLASVSANFIETIDDNPPTANPQSIVVGKNTPFNVMLTGTDFGGTPITFAIVHAPLNGTLVEVSSAVFTYTSTPGYSGFDSFIFTASDGFLTSETATVGILVAPVPSFNSPPQIAPNPVVFGQPAIFQASGSSLIGAVTITWNFGDGSTGSGANVTHIYTQPGLYTVTVTATALDGSNSTTTVPMFVSIGLVGSSPTGLPGGGALPPGTSGIIVGAPGAGKAAGSAAALSVNYVKRDQTVFAGQLGTINYPGGMTLAALRDASGVVTVGNAQTGGPSYIVTLNKSGMGKTTSMQLQVDLKRQRVKLKASLRPELTDLVEALGGTFIPNLKKGPTVLLSVPVTVQIGNTLFLGMTFNMQYHQTGNTGKGILAK